MYKRQKFVKPLRPYEVFMANVEAGNQEQLMIKDLVESYSLSIGQVRNYGVVCAVSTLENIYERFGYHVLDRTLRLCVGTWEGDMNSLSANMLNGIARLVYTFGDALKDETFKEKVGEMSVKLLSRTAKERRPGSMAVSYTHLFQKHIHCSKNISTFTGIDRPAVNARDFRLIAFSGSDGKIKVIWFTVSALMLFQGGFQRFYNIQENHHLIGTAIRKEQGDFFAGAPFSADDLLHQKPVGRYAQSIGCLLYTSRCV